MAGGKYDTTFAHGFTTDTWHHIAFVWSNTEDSLLYFDGQLVKTYTNLKGGTVTSATKISLGSNVANSATKLNGKLNDVRVYDNALSESEVKELARGLVLHYPLNRGGWGQENILTNSSGYQGTTNWSGVVSTGSENGVPYLIAKRTNTSSSSRTFCTHSSIKTAVSSWVAGDKFTISGYYKVPSTETYAVGGNMFIRWTYTTSASTYADTGFTTPTSVVKDEWIRFEYTYTVPASYQDGAVNFYLSAFANGLSTIYWKNIKLEKGEVATPWCPNSSDALATIMGLNSTTEYDISGFQNNGIKNNITYTSDTPKYDVSSIFNGTNSYIKVDNNSWMPQGATQMTINLWAKATIWPTNGGRLLSCMEGGGFKLEGGNSGYWRFPIHVYTAADLSATAYKHDSNEIKISALIADAWNMITLVYDNTGTKTYINGVLHHTYTNTSYGIHFNTNARLFLGCEANTASPSTPYFSGQESDFRIYATALSAEDIAQLYSENKLS